MKALTSGHPSAVALVVAATLFAAALPVYAQEGTAYTIIVNSSNRVLALSKRDISDLFLKKNGWSNGRPAAPIDQSFGSLVRVRFSLDIHGRDVKAIRSYWQQLLYQGKDLPPPTRSSDAEVIDFVSSKGNAVGYVARGTRLSDAVRILSIRD